MLVGVCAAIGKFDLDREIGFDVDFDVARPDVARSKRHGNIQGNKRPRIHPIIDRNEYDNANAKSEYSYSSRAV